MRTPETVYFLLVALISSGRGQFLLSLDTSALADATLSPGADDPNCADRIDNCRHYGSEVCSGMYFEWASHHCALTCKFCTGPPTSPLPCVDELDDCIAFDPKVCFEPAYSDWANENCRRTCRLCSAEDLAQLDAQTNTVSPSDCADRIDNCRQYGSHVCSGMYFAWASHHCALTCKICTGPPTSPLPCVDELDDCIAFEPKVCFEPAYSDWANENCRRTCRLCSAEDLAQLAQTTTVSPSDCADRTDDCHIYGHSFCGGVYEQWARFNCALTCNLCTAEDLAQLAQTTTVSPSDCADRTDDCHIYGHSVCGGVYEQWARVNCPLTCNLCTESDPTLPQENPVLTTTEGAPPLPTTTLPPY